MSDLQALKQKLQSEQTTSTLWSIQQKIQRFEHHLHSVELHYGQAFAHLLLLEEKLIIHTHPLD